MVSFADIQNSYNRVCAELRKYIWGFPVVAALADLEVAVYKTCQDLGDIRTKYQRLKSLIMDVVYTDEDLRDQLDSFESYIDEDEVYVKLNQVEEVVQI